MVLVVCLVVACGKGDGDKPAAKVEPAVGSAPVAPPADAAAVAATPAALSPKIKAARCGEPCLFLVDTPFATLTETYKTECAGMKTDELGYEDCKKIDYMRNCIYAAHGLVFKKKKWKLFAQKPWYDAHPEFDAKSIGPLERANVHELNQRGKACKKGFSISGGDFERISAWFKVLPKVPPMPKLVIFNTEHASGADFVKQLQEELSRGTNQPIKLAKGEVVATYVEKLDGEVAKEEVPEELLKLCAAQKARLVQLDFDAGTVGTEDNPITEGTHVWFAYDGTDQLIAIAGAHYLYD